MQQRVRAIVLSRLKYSESSQIVRTFTDYFGPVSLLVSGLGSKRGSKPGLLQPLTQIEFSMRAKSDNSLVRPKDLSLIRPTASIPFDVVKSTQALFLAEIMERCLRAHEADAGLFDFISACIDFLDHSDANPHLHLVFLAKLAEKLGFSPDFSENSRVVLTGRDANSWLNPKYELSDEESMLFRAVFGTKIDAVATLKLPRDHRRIVLNRLVEYYHLHLIGDKSLKSIEVLEALMS